MDRRSNENTVHVKPLGGGVTGRDSYILAQGLAYAIEAIEHLPNRWQEISNKEDMIELLTAKVGKREANDLRTGARGHLEQRNTVIIDRKRVVAPEA